MLFFFRAMLLSCLKRPKTMVLMLVRQKEQDGNDDDTMVINEDRLLLGTARVE